MNRGKKRALVNGIMRCIRPIPRLMQEILKESPRQSAAIKHACVRWRISADTCICARYEQTFKYLMASI